MGWNRFAFRAPSSAFEKGGLMEKRVWTFMVYIVGDNNLDPAALTVVIIGVGPAVCLGDAQV